MEHEFIFIALAIAILAVLIILLWNVISRNNKTSPAKTDESVEIKTQAILSQIDQVREDLKQDSLRLDQREKRLNEREDQLSANSELIRGEVDRLNELREQLKADKEQLKADQAALQLETERIAGLTSEEAQQEVLAQAKLLAETRAHQIAKQIEDEATRDAQRIAKQIIVTALERMAVSQTSESVVTAVDLPNEEMKGRIIGREGRNIRSFEQVTGVTVLIDDTPGSVLLSCFDPVRREAARLTLTALIEDGRIHPSNIEDAYQKAVAEVAENCLRAADDAIERAGLLAIDDRLRPTIGALTYRTSYGQNVLAHSVECAQLAGAMAAELGLDVQICKRAAFLHDIGKAVVTAGEGSHALEGAEIARKCGEDEVVVHAIAAHHNEIPAETVEDVLTQAADAISGSRPGARRESLEAYVKRMERLETIALSKPGVDKVFAMQAGRELRVMVLPEKVDDEASQVLAEQIAAEVEAEVTYPGRIRVTVIRESRAIATAH